MIKEVADLLHLKWYYTSLPAKDDIFSIVPEYYELRSYLTAYSIQKKGLVYLFKLTNNDTLIVYIATLDKSLIQKLNEIDLVKLCPCEPPTSEYIRQVHL